MKTCFAIAFLSFKEGLRQRLLYGVIIFSLLIMFFAVIVSGLFMRDISKIILDFCLSAINIGGLLVPFFLAIDLLSKDIERKTVFVILARPISRAQYIIGKFIGILLLTSIVMFILSCTTLVSIWCGKLLYADHFFENLSVVAIVLSIVSSWLGIIVLNALVVLWCSVTTSSFLATLLTLFTYFIGQSIDDVVRFLSVETPGVVISESLRYTMSGVQYLFPNLSVFDLKLQAAHGLIPPASELFFVFLYGATYTTAVLALAVIVFQRRDLA